MTEEWKCEYRGEGRCWEFTGERELGVAAAASCPQFDAELAAERELGNSAARISWKPCV